MFVKRILTDFAVVAVYGGSCWWWLRSPGNNQNNAANVNNDGNVNSNGNNVNNDNNAVRVASPLGQICRMQAHTDRAQGQGSLIPALNASGHCG